MSGQSKFGLLAGMTSVVVVAVGLYQKNADANPSTTPVSPPNGRAVSLGVGQPASLNAAETPTDPLLTAKQPADPLLRR